MRVDLDDVLLESVVLLPKCFQLVLRIVKLPSQLLIISLQVVPLYRQVQYRMRLILLLGFQALDDLDQVLILVIEFLDSPVQLPSRLQLPMRVMQLLIQIHC